MSDGDTDCGVVSRDRERNQRHAPTDLIRASRKRATAGQLASAAKETCEERFILEWLVVIFFAGGLGDDQLGGECVKVALGWGRGPLEGQVWAHAPVMFGEVLVGVSRL